MSNARQSRAATSADVDGDGDLDVVVPSELDQAVYWFETRADGLAPVRRVIASDLAVTSAAAGADFDGDGDVDFLISERGGGQLFFVDGLGRGEFAAPVLLGISGALGRNIQIADLDGDGDLDAVASNDVGIFTGGSPLLVENLDGTLAPARWIPGLGGRRLDLCFVDLDGDGLLDLLHCTQTQLQWTKNLGGLQFGSAAILGNTGGAYRDLEIADFDADGDEDFVVSVDLLDQVLLFENVTQSGIVDFASPVTLASGITEQKTIEIVDMDLDGDPDVVMASRDDAPLMWFENLAGLSFQLNQGLAAEESSSRLSLHSADLNLDGFTDLVATRMDGWIELWRGAPIGAGGVAFEPETRFVNSRTLRPRSLAAMQALGDSAADVLVIAGASGIQIAKEVEPGVHGVPVDAALLDVEVRGVVVGDADGDGDDDLFYVDVEGAVGWIERDGAGLGALHPIDLLPVSGQDDLLRKPIPADLDGDGDNDLLFAAKLGSQWSLLVYDQLAPGQFSARRVLEMAAFDYHGVEVGDADGDGVLDIFVDKGQFQLYEIRWLRGLGPGTFAPSSTVVIPGQEEALMCTGDFENDGRAEILFGVRSSPVIHRTEWLGMTFRSPLPVKTLPGDLRWIESVDWDSLDSVQVVVGHQDPDPGGFWRMDGLGGTGLSLVTRREFGGVDSELASFLLFDAGEDGDRDFALAYASGSRVSFFRNLSRVPLGVEYCAPAALNSSGFDARITALGSARPGEQDLRIVATDLPPSSTVLFLASLRSSVVQGPGGSVGTLCLGGSIGRFARPGEIQTSSAGGIARLEVDLWDLPQPSGSYRGLNGEVWRFQAWYRDAGASNFSTALAVLLF